ncbi:MAG: disulfide bond formation protein B [Alphaproteobacteria bacterium]|nr:disulfide bond formation protein B [Alphaproteobacteria bacterium]
MKSISGRVISTLFVLCILGVMGGGSLYAQYGLNYTPCQLCLAQRYCVVCCIILMLLALALHRFPRLYQRIVDITCIGLFLGFIAAMYQLLIQYRIIPEPDFCRVNLPVNVSLEELESIIRQNTTVSCANFGPTVLDFPMSAYSAVAFMFIFVYFSLTSNSEDTEGSEK